MTQEMLIDDDEFDKSRKVESIVDVEGNNDLNISVNQNDRIPEYNTGMPNLKST